VLQVYHFS